MRLSTALSLGIDPIAKSIEQLQQGAPTPPPSGLGNESPVFKQVQQNRNADAFGGTGADLRSRYATQLQGTPTPFTDAKSTQPQAKLFQNDSFKAFSKPPVALKAPPLPRQPAFVRV